MTKILIVDDHQIIIDGIKALLKDVANIEVVGAAHNGVELMHLLTIAQPDLILMDIGMPNMDGIDASIRVKATYPAIKILIFTTYSTPQKIKKALKIGVEGYLLKGSGRAALLHAISQIMAGNIHHDQRIVKVIMENLSGSKNNSTVDLTKRELQIVQLIAEGHKTKEIAEELFLSPLTIETHRKNIFSKLGINNIAALVRYAVKEGLVD